MSHKVYCQKLQQELEGLTKPPYPGELGEKIYKNISKQAWSEWLSHQTMLINEYRLSLIEPKSREFLKEQMVAFLFEGQQQKPDGYQPPEGQEHN